MVGIGMCYKHSQNTCKKDSGLLSALMSNDKYRRNFIVYGHNEVIDALRTFCRLTLPGKILKYIDERIFWGEVKDGYPERNPGTANLFFRYSFYQDEAVRIPGFVTRWTGAGLSGRRTL